MEVVKNIIRDNIMYLLLALLLLGVVLFGSWGNEKMDYYDGDETFSSSFQ